MVGPPLPAHTVRGPYLRPVAEHLPISSVGHKLLGKLWRTQGCLRWGHGEGGLQLGWAQGSWPPKWPMALGGGVGGWGVTQSGLSKVLASWDPPALK